jgi:hypothetical protein
MRCDVSPFEDQSNDCFEMLNRLRRYNLRRGRTDVRTELGVRWAAKALATVRNGL